MDPTRTVSAPLDQAGLEALLGELGASAGAYRFRVAPNPCVGAAVLSDGVEVGRGFHRDWGDEHAEVLALRAAGQSGVPRERWDTLVVTLEPCSSTGKQPPCVQAVLEAGIGRVIAGAEDPDPRHRGRGLEELRAAGVETHVLPRAAPLVVVSPHFLQWTDPDRLRRPRPWTIAKWAQTRTGQMLPPENVGEGRWISGPESRDEVQVLRGRVDAIVTGVGTVLADDPRLTVRSPGRLVEPPLRVVLDSDLRTPADARIFAPAEPDERGGAVHLFARAGAHAPSRRALEKAGATIHTVRSGDDGRPLLREILAQLWENGARRILLEAGPTLLEATFAAELVDQVAVYTGPINGGRGPTLAKRLQALQLTAVEHRESGADAVLEAFV